MSVAIDFVGVGLGLPVLPFFVLSLGGDASSTAAAISTFSFFQILSGLWMGLASDRVGRRPIMLTSIGGVMFGSLATTLSTNVPMLFLARAWAGFFSGTMPVAQGYLAEICSQEERTKRMASLGAIPGLVLLILPPLGSLLTLSPVGLRSPFAAAVIAAVLDTLNFRRVVCPPPAPMH